MVFGLFFNKGLEVRTQESLHKWEEETCTMEKKTYESVLSDNKKSISKQLSEIGFDQPPEDPTLLSVLVELIVGLVECLVGRQLLNNILGCMHAWPTLTNDNL